MVQLLGVVKKTVTLPYRVLYAVVAKIAGYENVDLLMQYFTFIFGWLIGWLILVGTYKLLLGFHLWNGLSYAAGLLLTILFTFAYHRYVTFVLKTDRVERFMKFAPLQLGIAAANWLLFLAGTELLHLHDVATSFVVTFFLSLANFAANRLLVFHREDSGKSF